MQKQSTNWYFRRTKSTGKVGWAMFWVSTNHVPWADVRRRLHNINITLKKKTSNSLQLKHAALAYSMPANCLEFFVKFTSSFHYFINVAASFTKSRFCLRNNFKVLNDRVAQDRKNCTQGSNFDGTCATVPCQQKAPHSTKGQASSIKFIQRSSWSWWK